MSDKLEVVNGELPPAVTLAPTPEAQVPVTDMQAEEAMMIAEMGEFFDINVVSARTVIGRLTAQKGGGYLVAQSEINLGMNMAYQQMLVREVMGRIEAAKKSGKSLPLNDICRVGEVLSKLGNTAANHIAIRQDGVDAVGSEDKESKRKSRAPQSIRGIVYQAENMQVNGASPKE